MYSLYADFTADEKVMFVIAITCSVIFVIQLIMILIGFGADELDLDFDDFDGEGLVDFFGLRLLSFKSIVAGAGVFTWTYLACGSFESLFWKIFLSVAAGLTTLIVVAYIMKKLSEIDTDGNIDVNKSIGQIATVYLTVPKNRSGIGKVNVVLQERLIELDAMTEEDDDLKSNSKVEVVKIENNMIIVKKI